MRQWPPDLAPPTELTGQLQRGTGAGFIRAVGSDGSAVREALFVCLREDPSWDRQLDDRDDYYATLALRVGLDLDPLRRWLEDGDPDRNLGLVLGVTARLAVRGHADAQQLLREYVAYGDLWDDAVRELTYDSDPIAATDGLDTVILERFPDLGEGLEAAHVDWSEPPWSLWRERHSRFAAVAAEVERLRTARRAAKKARKRGPRFVKPHRRTTPELMDAEPADWRRIGRELASRGDVDVAALRRLAAQPEHPSRPAAITALGHLGDATVLEVAEEITDDRSPGHLHAAVTEALTAMPGTATAELAQQWLVSEVGLRRRKAAHLLERHATAAEIGSVREALHAELDRQLEGDQYVVCSLGESLGRFATEGPYPELTRAFVEMPYSYGRHYIAEALARTDPGFAGAGAFEALFDCESFTREIGVDASPLESGRSRARLVELAEDKLGDRHVRARAQERLGSRMIQTTAADRLGRTGPRADRGSDH